MTLCLISRAPFSTPTAAAWRSASPDNRKPSLLECQQGSRPLLEIKRLLAVGNFSSWFMFYRVRKYYSLSPRGRRRMNGLIYLIGLIVVIMFVLSFLGLR
jgi:hypothetical protein